MKDKSIFTRQNQTLINLFRNARHPDKVICVPIDYAKQTHKWATDWLKWVPPVVQEFGIPLPETTTHGGCWIIAPALKQYDFGEENASPHN